MAPLRIAGRELLTERIPADLRPYSHAAEPTAPLNREPRAPAAAPAATRRATGLVAGRDRAVECRFVADSIEVRIEGVASFAVAGDGRSIRVGEVENSAPGSLVDDALLGPPLLLALALQGVPCLHASAVAAEQGVVAWLGPSGAGKSTLAAYLGRDGSPWKRCADDLLPVEVGPDGTHALPHFPQLKLPAAAQWCGQQPERLPLRALYLLGESEAEGRGVTIEPLAPTDAVLEILRQTAAWSLYSPDLAGRHLAMCARIAETVPVRRLSYPRRFEILPEVAAAIRADLQARS